MRRWRLLPPPCIHAGPLRDARHLALLGLLWSALAASEAAEGRDFVSPGLLADVVSVAYGERPCEEACTEDLARRLEASGELAGVCAAALRGTIDLPPASLSWVRLLRSHLPVWRLLQRRTQRQSANVEDAVLQEGLPELWFQILPLMRKAVEKGWWGGVARPFSRFLRGLRQWPSRLVRVEKLLQTANALRLGANVFSVLAKFEPPLVLVQQVGDFFINQAQRLLMNVTQGLRYTERLLALLRHNEEMRISFFDLLAHLLPEDPVVVFGGAHAGAVLLNVLTAMPDAKIYAFEADPFIFQSLERNFRDHPRVTPIMRALYKRGDMSLRLRTRNGIGSQSTLYTPTQLMEETWPWIEWGATATVGTVALGPWSRREGVGRVDFIYLDIECAELAALQGAREVLENVTAVHLEVSREALCEGGPLWTEVQRFLHSRGFRLLVVPTRPWEVRFDVTALRWPLPGRRAATSSGGLTASVGGPSSAPFFTWDPLASGG